MTVYEWINSKDHVTINFNKYIDDDYTENLEIKMDIQCKCVRSNNDYNRLTYFPITTTRTFYNIPQNDVAMIAILDRMYKDLIEFFNEIKYKNK